MKIVNTHRLSIHHSRLGQRNRQFFAYILEVRLGRAILALKESSSDRIWASVKTRKEDPILISTILTHE